MSTLREIWAPVAVALGLAEVEAPDVLFAACLQAAEDEVVALRIHCALAARYGLRSRLAPSQHEAPYRELPPDPLSGGRKDTMVAFKKAAASWRGQHLVRALEQTAEFAAVERERGRWRDTLIPHPTGCPAADRPERCVDCAWSHETPVGRRCRRASQLVAEGQTGCAVWEAGPLAGDPDPCAPCGACCRGRFSHVVVADTDPSLPTGLVIEVEGERQIPHGPDGCPALSPTAPYRCGVHAARPFICRDFPVGGDACLEARRFMGVS